MKLRQARLITALLALCNAVYAEENPYKEGRLNMGFYANSITEQVNRSDIEVSLNFWSKDLLIEEGKKKNLYITSSNSVLFDRIEDLEKAFVRGEIDMIVAPPLLIARYFKRADLRDGFMGVHQRKKQDKLLLIARTDKNIDGIKNLLGKRLVMQDGDELADMFLDTLVLKEFKQDYKNIGLSIKYQSKSSRIILDVFFDKADVAVIYDSSFDIMSELNPEIRKKIKTLAEFPIKSKNFSYFYKNYPLIDELTSVSMTFKDSPRATQILEVFKTSDIDYCKVTDLDSFDKFYKDYLLLKQRAKK